MKVYRAHINMNLKEKKLKKGVYEWPEDEKKEVTKNQ